MTQRRAGVLWAILRPKKRFVMTYRHGPICLTCVEGTTQSSTKHERVVLCRHRVAQIPPLIGGARTAYTRWILSQLQFVIVLLVLCVH